MFQRVATVFLLSLNVQLIPLYYGLAVDTNAKNVADLELLCHIIKLHSASTESLDDGDLPNTEKDELEKLNTTLSVPAWKGIFQTAESKDDEDPAYCSKASDKPACIKQWNKWKKLAAAAAASENLPSKVLHDAAKLTSPAGTAAQLMMAQILAEADALEANYKTNIQKEITAAKKLQTGKLQDAIFGKQAKPDTANSRCTAAVQTNRQITCKPSKAVATVCGTAVCICAKDATQQNGDLCSDATSSTQLNYGSSNIGTVYEAIASKCAHAPAEKLSSQRIHSLIAAFKARLKTYHAVGGAVVYLGTVSSDTNNCASSDSNGCADFTELAASKAVTAVKTDNWIDQLLEAAETLRIAEAATNKRKETVTRLQNLLKKGRELYTRLAVVEAPTLIGKPTDGTTGATNKHQAATAKEEAKKECNSAKD
uniref:Variant surface glycoprotein 1125.4936 n=1 Tax=Trypanosoma brucei TaxID=5691 RepID=A0A1J0RBE6_9TRYP|nr:variant surface glycoprotein 1125.4936 [Trypanosoma brucei]